MNNRWTFEEESKLLKLISSGKTYAELSPIFNRSENALEMRVKKIIYDNVSTNKPVDKIAELLNMSKEKIMQYYYSYKDHLDRENKKHEEDKQIGGKQNNVSSSKLNTLNNNLNLNKVNNKINNPQNNNSSNIQNNNIQNNNLKMNGGFNKSDKIEKLENQNRKMKLLLENYILKHKLSKVLKSNNKHMNNDIIKTLINM